LPDLLFLPVHKINPIKGGYVVMPMRGELL